MIEIKRIQQQPDLAKAIYAVMIAVYPVKSLDAGTNPS
ncbi:acetyltransferase [Streptococcus pneumoniae]|nr:acetyltransferase [Streptococcus pneumoniae]